MFSKSTVKYIQSLQHKKFRDEYGTFVAEGPKLVAELLEGNRFTCKNIYALQQWADDASSGLSKYAAIITPVKDFELEKISALATPNKLLAVFEQRIPDNAPKLKARLTLVLDDIQDPGNLGTIIRTADWFGIENIICSANTVDMYNSKVVQSTMASLGRVNVLYTELETFLQKHAGIRKYATLLDGKPLSKLGRINEGFILIGNEAKGLSEPLKRLADEKITIPQSGQAESLNAAVAAGIVLFAFTQS